MSKKKSESTLEKLVPILLISTIGLAFMVGVLWQKIADIKDGSAVTDKKGEQAADNAGAADPSAVLEIESLKEYAKELSLDEGKFASCLDDGNYEGYVKKDISQAEEAGISGTPGFLVNGLVISGAQPYLVFKDVLEYELAGGDWDNPEENVAYLVDGNKKNGEISTERQTVETGDAPAKGEKNAPITMVEFSDFECSYCGRFYTQTLSQIEENYIKTGKVRLVYKHLPLTLIHKYAQKAAEASMCADKQGKFWEYHNLLFRATTTGG